jgi:hypothetical protein
MEEIDYSRICVEPVLRYPILQQVVNSIFSGISDS